MKKKNKNKIKSKAESTEVTGTSETDASSETKIKDVSKSIDKPSEIKRKLESDIAELKTDLKREVDRRLRLMAEYDNYRKRTQSEYQRLYETAGERVIMKLLPIIDDFQRFLDQDITSAEPSRLKQGIELIYKKLMESMDSEGVKPIDAMGKEFDAEIHEAIAQLEDESKPAATIIAEVERGYYLGEKVIRHPKVVVNTYSKKEIESKNE